MKITDTYVTLKIRAITDNIDQMQRDLQRLAEALMSDPQFVEVDLQELVENGVMMAANEAFFWPLGLALTWTVEEDGSVSDLHVRQWDYGDPDHRETITLDGDDPVADERRGKFDAWSRDRIERLPREERQDARRIMVRARHPRQARPTRPVDVR